MNFIKKLWADKFAPPPASKSHTIVVQPPAPKTAWRNNMWVMTPEGPGIIFRLQEPVLVHLVNISNGETRAEVLYASEHIRQAKYMEIPECRRGDKTKLTALGYE
jgi:hypothetical protein